MALVVLTLGERTRLLADRPLLKRKDAQIVRELSVALQALRAAFEDERRQLQGRSEDRLRMRQSELEEQHRARLAQSLLGFHDALRRELATVADGFVDAVLVTARNLVGQRIPPEFFAQAISAARDYVAGSTVIELRVAPADQHQAAEGLALLPGIEDLGIRLVADPQLAPGGCVLSTKLGRVDAGLQTQLDALREHMRKHAVRGKPEHGSGSPASGRDGLQVRA